MLLLSEPHLLLPWQVPRAEYQVQEEGTFFCLFQHIGCYLMFYSIGGNLLGIYLSNAVQITTTGIKMDSAVAEREREGEGGG